MKIRTVDATHAWRWLREGLRIFRLSPAQWLLLVVILYAGSRLVLAANDLADVSGHLTPQTLRTELMKLMVDVPIYAQHIKPQFISDIVGELAELSDPPVTPLEQGKEYTFLTS